MLRFSKNIKKVALSLLVVGLAIGTQAFVNAEKNVTPKKGATFQITDNFLVQRTVGELEQVNPSIPTQAPNSLLCETEPSSLACTYEVTEDGKENIRPLTEEAPVYTTGEISTFISLEYITPVGPTGRIYAD